MRAFIVVGFALISWAPADLTSQEKKADEKQRIEALIEHIEKLKGVKFVRNDQEYDAKSAARFLREKWNTNRGTIKTAQDFIEKVASVSGTTGKPYVLRFDGKKEIESRKYLGEVLQKLNEAAKSPKSDPTLQ